MAGILILGASGLLGHKLFEQLSTRFEDITATVHGPKQHFSWAGLFDGPNTIDQFEAEDFDHVCAQLNRLNPDTVVNAIGITKRKPRINERRYAYKINSDFPKLLAKWTGQHGKRLIHFSTNCVFDGTAASYSESCPPNNQTTYGSTKAAGEITAENVLTLRTSFIGRELSHHTELLDWLLAQQGKSIAGYTSSLFCGVSTKYISQVVADVIEFHPQLWGLYNLAITEPISKYQLLCLARDTFGIDVEIIPEETHLNNAVLDGSLLRHKLDLMIPPWQQMMADIANDSLYDRSANDTTIDGMRS